MVHLSKYDIYQKKFHNAHDLVTSPKLKGCHLGHVDL